MKFISLPTKEDNRGFTLIEILVVIGIIAVLAAVVLIAINPARQFAQARDSQRTSNVNAILNAAGQYLADNQGDDAGLNIPDGEIDKDFCDAIVPTYMPAMPTDPSSDVDGADISDCSTISSGDVVYEVETDTNGRIEVCSDTDEDTLGRTDPICVTR